MSGRKRFARLKKQARLEAERKAYEDYGIIKTWKWILPKGSFSIPDQIEPRHYYCYHCRNGREHPADYLVPYVYEGKTVYVCRSCGTVYEINPAPDKWYDVFRVWRSQYYQPYYWEYFSDNYRKMARDFIDRSGDITRHPLLDAHCRGDSRETAETIVRYLICMGWEEWESWIRLFLNSHGKSKTTWDHDELVISVEREKSWPLPKGEFSVFREGKDYFSLEVSSIHRENIFGYTLDVNSEDWEYYEFYTFCRLTFISKDDHDLPEDIELIHRIPVMRFALMNYRPKLKAILKDPFGLDGYFLLENKLAHNFLGTEEELLSIWLDNDDEDEDDEEEV